MWHASGKESTCQCRRHKKHGFNPWVGKIPWRRKWQHTPIFLPGKFHGQRRLVGYSPWVAESDMPERLSTGRHRTTREVPRVVGFDEAVVGGAWEGRVTLIGFPGGFNLPANAGDTRDIDSIPGSRRFSGGRNGNPFQYSCLENSMDRGAWRATVHGVTKGWICLSVYTHTHTHTLTHTVTLMCSKNWKPQERLRCLKETQVRGTGRYFF